MTDAPRFRMLALDLDGTLTTSDKKVTPRTRTAVHAAIDAGVYVVLASGRPLVGVAPVASTLQLDQHGGYLACNNGSYIIDWKSKRVLVNRTISRNAVELSCQVAHEYGVAAICYDEQRAYSEKPADPYVEQERFNNSSTMVKVDDLAAFVDWAPNKIMVVGEPSQLEGAYDRLRQLLQGEATVIHSEPYFVEVVPAGVGKDAALAKLGALLGVDRSQTIAVGDGYNDLSMLDYAGLAVAMDNAYDGVKPHADWVAPSNDDDGVAAVIERYILQPAEQAEAPSTHTDTAASVAESCGNTSGARQASPAIARNDW